jgi:hypothetical protein
MKPPMNAARKPGISLNPADIGVSYLIRYGFNAPCSKLKIDGFQSNAWHVSDLAIEPVPEGVLR